MPDPTPITKTAIPESLRLQLNDFRRQLWRIKIIEAVAAGVVGLLVSFLLVFGLDRIMPTPQWLRLAILIGGASLFSVFAPYWLHRWVWRKRRENQLARLISKRYPGLGDRLLGAIELQDQESNQETLSARLKEAAMEAVATEAKLRELDEALPPKRHRIWALAALITISVSAITLISTPQAGFNALERWLLPLSDTQRYTFTKLENPPTYLAVPFGESFHIRLKLAKNSEQVPAIANGRYAQQPAVTANESKNSYNFKFPGQQEPGTISFRIGDLRHEIRVEPMQRPAVEKAVATIKLPSYLNIPDRKVELTTGVIGVVEGSKISVELQMTRALKSGKYGPSKQIASEPSSPEISPPSFHGDLSINKRFAKTPTLAVGSTPFEIPFSWTDINGLAGDTGFRLRIDATSDSAPYCYLQGVDRQIIILPEETIDFEVLAEDDFGIKASGIEWAGQFNRPTNEVPASGELLLKEGRAEERRMLEPVAFSPKAFNITPQKLILRGWAEDHMPDRGRIYSEPVIIYVLTRNEHAQLLKNDFDRQITELEDLARRERNLLEENQRLERMDGEELKTEDAKRRLEKQQNEEADTKRRMEDLNKNMEELMKDAVRNGDIKKETLKKMAEALKDVQELSETDIPKVENKLADAGQPSNSSEKSEKDMEEAVKEQEKALEKMEQAIAKANEAKRQFEAGTFVKRLKKAAEEENGIVQVLTQAFTTKDPHETILGDHHRKLDPSVQNNLSNTSNQQASTASDIRWIQEDLAHFFARTQEETFKQILDEMNASDINIELSNVRLDLAKNHSFNAAKVAK